MRRFRRRQKRKTIELARILLALDDIARDALPERRARNRLAVSLLR
jgi:hypothetical protein